MDRPRVSYLLPANLDSPSAAHFWEGLRHRRLLAQRCRRCGEVFFPPRPVCPECLAQALEPAELSGRGRLASWTGIRRGGPHFEAPWVLGLVDLEEGVGRIAAAIVDPDDAEATPVELERRLEIGMPVRIGYLTGRSGFVLYCLMGDAG